MESLNIVSVYRIIQEKFLEVYNAITRHFKETTTHILVRNESNTETGNTQHLLEIIDSQKIDGDDYGIVACVNVEHKGNSIRIVVESLKSYGPIISSEEFELLSDEKSMYKLSELNNALVYLNNLPDILYSSITDI